jgi:apolipoprotein N-acyltransferase
MPMWRWRAAAAALGALAALGQAPWGLWAVSLPALAGLIVLVSGPGRREGAWRAWFGGAGYFGLALNWLVQPFMVDAARDGWMAPFALLFMAFGLALFWALAALVPARNRALGFALTLTLAELARGYVLTGFPWAQIGHIWIDTPVAQVAAWVGPSGLTLLTLLLAYGLTRGRAAWRVALGLATVWGFGLWLLAAPMPEPRAITLRLVQPDAAQQTKWDPDLAQQFFDRLLAYTAVKPAPDLVIWPETALPYLIERHPEIAQIIAEAANGATVALGLQRSEGAQGWNSLRVIGADGSTLANYDKFHLVPFGEYIPFGDALFAWANISAFASASGNGYMAGPGPQVIDLGALGKMQPLICYEAVFPQDLRGAGRADWLLQITNDAWFGVWSGPFQHADQARLRAIEQGLPMVRVANTGVTAVYDARGRVTASLTFGIASYLDVALPSPLPATIYAQFGEIPVLLLLGGLFGLLYLRRTPARA